MAPGGRTAPAGPPCLVLPWAMADGARNMAIDEAMLEVAAGGRTLLRFYGWDPWCVSLGRNQPAPARLLGRARGDVRPGVDAVRRPTGGRSVFHGPEITYAFACPDRAWGGPRAVLRRLHAALAAGLRALGVPVDDVPEGGGAAAASTGPFALTAAGCFREPAPGELTVDGRKLVGSAQRRRRGALLQHGSILLEDRQTLADLDGPPPAAARATAPAGGSVPRPSIGLRETMSEVPDAEIIVRLFERILGPAFGAPAAAGRVEAALRDVHRLAPPYERAHRSAARLWRSQSTPASRARPPRFADGRRRA